MNKILHMNILQWLVFIVTLVIAMVMAWDVSEEYGIKGIFITGPASFIIGMIGGTIIDLLNSAKEY